MNKFEQIRGGGGVAAQVNKFGLVWGWVSRVLGIGRAYKICMLWGVGVGIGHIRTPL